METIQLSPSEKALIEGNHDFSKTKARYVRYRINKKLKLIECRDAVATPQQQQQLLEDIVKDDSSKALVAQLAEQGFVAVSSTENNTNERITESSRRDLNARPKVYETFALPAELLGRSFLPSYSHLLFCFAQVS